MANFTPKFYGKKEKNRFAFDDKEAFSIYMDKFKDGAELELTVKRKYKKRTSGAPGEETNFNGYYWKICVAMIANEIGNADHQQVHDWVQMSIGRVKRMPDGREVAESTSELSGGEFAEMCGRVRTWAGTNEEVFGPSGFFIPEPNDISY